MVTVITELSHSRCGIMIDVRVDDRPAMNGSLVQSTRCLIRHAGRDEEMTEGKINHFLGRVGIFQG